MPQRVCVVGNLNIDLIVRGVPGLPRWGQEVAGTSHVAASAGQAGYLALALARLGTEVGVVANVGDDAFGRQILDDLRRAGVDTRAVETAYGATGITVGIVREDGERAFVSDFASLHAFDLDLVERHWDAVAQADVVALVGQFCLSRITPPIARRILGRARAAGRTTVLDTGWDPAGWPAETVAGVRALLAEVAVFLPNRDEAAVLTGVDDPAAAARLLLADGPEIVVVKSGAAGSLAATRDATVALPAIPVAVHDAVGAGDTFNGGFLHGLARGWPLERCLAFGNAAAALYVSRLADRFPGATEAEALAARLLPPGPGPARPAEEPAGR